MLKFSFFCTFFSIFRQLLKKMQHGVRSNMVRLFFIIWFFLVINYLSLSLLGLLSFCSWFLLGFLRWHVIWPLRVGKQRNYGFRQKLRGHSFPGWHQQGKRNANHWQALKWMKGWANCKTVFWGNFKRDALLQKQEDNELVNLKPLPTAKPVNLPDGITAELYGDIAMLTEFVYTFQDLLLPKEKLYISTGTDCFHLFFFVAVCLVKIILLFFLL